MIYDASMMLSSSHLARLRQFSHHSLSQPRCLDLLKAAGCRMCGLADSGSDEHEVEPPKAFGPDLLDFNQWWWSKQEIALICRLSKEEQLRR